MAKSSKIRSFWYSSASSVLNKLLAPNPQNGIRCALQTTYFGILRYTAVSIGGYYILILRKPRVNILQLQCIRVIINIKRFVKVLNCIDCIACICVDKDSRLGLNFNKGIQTQISFHLNTSKIARALFLGLLSSSPL